MAELLYRLGKSAARRAWVAILAWAAILAATVGGFAVGFGQLSSSFDIPDTPSSAVIAELEDQLPDFAGASGMVVFRTDDGSALTDQQQAEISALITTAADLPDVAEVVDPFATEQQRADQVAQLQQATAQIEAGFAEIDAGQAQLDTGFAQLNDAQEQLDAGRAQLEAANLPESMLAAQLAALDAQQSQLDAGRAELEQGQAQLDTARSDLEAGATQTAQGTALLELADGIGVVSSNGSTALVNVAFTLPRMELPQESKDAVIEHFTAEAITGVEIAFSTEIAQGVPEILGVGEVIGVAIAAIVLLVMLGSVLAASFPIITALTGVAIGVLGTLAFSGVVQMASVTPVLGVMLGLAVGIDYTLFIVYRHRKQLLQGAEVHESIGLANGTAGNAVVFAGSTVIVALLALNVTGVPFLGLMGTSAAVCVAIAVLIAISLTPALLGLAGMRVLSRKARQRAAAAREALDGADAAVTDAAVTDAAASRFAATSTSRGDRRRARTAHTPVRQMSTGRAIVTAVIAVAALLVVAIPSLSMRLGLPDGASEPHGSYAERAHTIVADEFGEGANSALLITAALPGDTAAEDVLGLQAEIAHALADMDDVVAVASIAVSEDRSLAAFQVLPAEGPNSESIELLVRDLREQGSVETSAGQVPLGVAGQAAINIDISESLQDVLPLYLTVVVGLSLLIMIVVFRSILVPVIATGGFILSLFATFGAIVAVFQWGWLAPVFGITNPGPILSFLPVILIGILFGLAMDYQLFLSTGMREAFVHGSPARLAVAQGFRAGRSVVIAAGLIMVSVFGGFVFSESTIIRSLGFGLALGVLLDAFVVRLALMPALMHLIGRAAWWNPRWLDRILPNVDVEGAALERRHAHR